MREDETFLVVGGILAVLVLAFVPLYLKFLKKMLARRETSLPSPAPLQKKPVIAFDRAWTTLVKAYATPRAEPEEPVRLPQSTRVTAPAPQPAPLVTVALPRPEPSVTAETTAVRPLETSGGILLSEVQSGYVRIVNQARSIQNRIRRSRGIWTAIGPKNPLERQEAVRFNENVQAIDQLAGLYTLHYHTLRSLMESEKRIESAEVLQDHRRKEFETIQQIAAVSQQIQPLLTENEDIVAPFAGDLR